MRWLSVLRWSLVGLITATVGRLVGGLFGSFWPQTVVAATAAGAAFGSLVGRPRLIVTAVAAAAAVSAPAFYLGRFTVSLLLGWPDLDRVKVVEIRA
jgi:hypothetical protein